MLEISEFKTKTDFSDLTDDFLNMEFSNLYTEKNIKEMGFMLGLRTTLSVVIESIILVDRVIFNFSLICFCVIFLGFVDL